MRKKEPSLVITFATTTQAMAMEKYCITNHIPGRIIPVPREITAGCGLAYKTTPKQKETLLQTMKQADITWSDIYELEI